MKNLLTIAMLSLPLSLLYAQDGIKAYNNFDFIPGESILFEDNFNDAPQGEFAPRWNLHNGQAVVTKDGEQNCLLWTEGSPGTISRISPAMKKKEAYLGESFTVEFDFQINDEQELHLIFKDEKGESGAFLTYGYLGEIRTNYFPEDIDLKGAYTGGEDAFMGKWHHASFAYKNGQMKCYLDQYRTLVIPKCGFVPTALFFGGCEKVKLSHVKIAEGGGMNMLGKILTEGKFVSHAIKFDVNKATIKGESMGFMNELAKWLKENQAVKLEVGGHTDSDGDDASNLKLSQARAEAVKSQLVQLGVDASRLSAKGYGEAVPMQPNATPEGKANNRRVEFKKM